jgi:hypothetical protein
MWTRPLKGPDKALLDGHQNTNIEIRNSKQYQRTQIQMTQTVIENIAVVPKAPVLNIGKFEFRICYGFRASDFGFMPVLNALYTAEHARFLSLNPGMI